MKVAYAYYKVKEKDLKEDDLELKEIRALIHDLREKFHPN